MYNKSKLMNDVGTTGEIVPTLRLRMISLITALLYIDAAAMVSIHNIASRLNEKQVQNLRPDLPDNKARVKLQPHSSSAHEKYNLVKPYVHPNSPAENNKESEIQFPHSSDNGTEMEGHPSLEDELEKEHDSSAEDEIEKENSSENETLKKPSPNEIIARTSQTSCLDGWVYNHDLSTCYSFYQTKMNWIQAEMSCQMYVPGGHLASIHWEEHNQFIQDLIKRNNPVPTGTWIGLSDCHKESVYLWTDGSATDFTKWNRDLPEDKEEVGNCATINSEGIGGIWDDRTCSDELPFVCAYKLF
ncbi:uncharacterized protein [Narcine bancroftii]|uniref:uncharacterized protein isoform X3 n=1 Tax=Narcine bancroftii TaxID=1343680 RepID=UPI0038311F8D